MSSELLYYSAAVLLVGVFIYTAYLVGHREGYDRALRDAKARRRFSQ